MEDNMKIMKGINLHMINTQKFKTNLIAVFLTTKLERENITKGALLPAVLRLGNAKIKTQNELNKKLDNMYGANFNCGIEKRGNNHVLKFYLESIDDEFAIDHENILEESINFLIDIVFNPLISNFEFTKSYVEGEKENLKKIIQAKIDNKSIYSYIRCIEEMYKNKDFGLYEYGYVQDLDSINSQNLYEYYRKLLDKCKIDIFVSGNLKDKDKIINMVKDNPQISELNDRDPEYVKNSIEEVANNIETKEIKESMDVTQGKVVIGLSIKNSFRKEAVISVYNAILGGGANSKLFQNVREKASLAYTAGSVYLKAKNNIFIKCGIEIKNYTKVVRIIKEQLSYMKEGKILYKEIKNAKELIIASLRSISDEQSNEISYALSQELSDTKLSIEDFIKEISMVNKNQIQELANDIEINTIYFLENEEVK